jgi:hypothetical protein
MTGHSEDGHIDAATVEAYERGVLEVDREVDVEEHLLDCAQCREMLAGMAAEDGLLATVSTERLEQIWGGLQEEVAATQPGVVESVLSRLGLPAAQARLLTAAPSLRGPWLLGIAAALGFALVAALTAGPRGVGLFLAVAPLLPVAGVAVAYGPHTDPMHELAAAAPHPASDTVLLRTLAVLLSTIPLAVLAGVLLPSAPVWIAAAWLLPALAFTALLLAAGTVMDPLWAAAGIIAVWATVVLSATVRRLDPLVFVQPAAQILFLVLLLSAVGVVLRRRQDLAFAGGLT